MVSSISAALSAVFTTNIFPHIVKCSLVGDAGWGWGVGIISRWDPPCKRNNSGLYLLSLLISGRVSILLSFVYLLTLPVGSHVGCPYAIHTSLLEGCTHLTMLLPYHKHLWVRGAYLSIPTGESSWCDFPLQMAGLEDMIATVGERANVRTWSQVWATFSDNQMLTIWSSSAWIRYLADYLDSFISSPSNLKVQVPM